MTLYVESNFVLEIALGQEELATAERLLAAAEARRIPLAIPAFSLAKPLGRVTRSVRDRLRLAGQLNAEVAQLKRSAVHRTEVAGLQRVPGLVETINLRESDRLTNAIARILECAKQIALSQDSFRAAVEYQGRYNLSLEDAIILAVVAADVRSSPSMQRHLFANKNRSDFGSPAIVAELNRLGCDPVWSFAEAARRLGV